MFTKWREKHPKKVDPYDLQERRLHEYISTLECGTEKFKEAQSELDKVSQMRERSRESRKKFDKAGRAGLWTKIVGGTFTLLGIGALGYYEMKGNTFTGEKRKAADGFTNLLVNLFRNR